MIGFMRCSLSERGSPVSLPLSLLVGTLLLPPPPPLLSRQYNIQHCAGFWGPLDSNNRWHTGAVDHHINLIMHAVAADIDMQSIDGGDPCLPALPVPKFWALGSRSAPKQSSRSLQVDWNAIGP